MLYGFIIVNECMINEGHCGAHVYNIIILCIQEIYVCSTVFSMVIFMFNVVLCVHEYIVMCL